MDDVSALILLGGQSSRFGSPKGLISNHNIPQWQYMYNLLIEHCEQVYFSLNQSTRAWYPDIEESKVIYDKAHALRPVGGPMAGVLAAMHSYPQRAWLVVSIDLLFLDHNTVSKLLSKRQQNTLVTLYFYEEMQPLCAIYEYPACAILSQLAGEGKYSLLKAIKSIPHTLISAVADDNKNKRTNIEQMEDEKQKPLPHPLSNINSVEDLHSIDFINSSVKEVS